MAFREEYLETPLPLPPRLYGRSLGRSVVRWRHNQIFSAWWVTIFSYPWCFAGALSALKLRYNHAMSISELLFAAFCYFLLFFLIKKLNILQSTCGASLYNMRILFFNK